jgi:hypothetical protein
MSQAALDAERRQAVSYSISTLLTRNLHDVFGENDPARRRAAVDEIFTEDCVFYEPKGVYRGRDEIDRVAGAIKATHPDFRYQPMPRPRNWAMAGASNGYRAALGSRRLTPGLISSLPGTAGLPPSISFSTSCLEQRRGSRKLVFRLPRRSDRLPHRVQEGVEYSLGRAPPPRRRRRSSPAAASHD